MNTLENARSLRDAGYFAAALTALDAGRLGPNEHLSADVVRAELLERTGQYSQGRRFIETLLQKRNLTDPDRSTCEMVLGKIELESGDVAGGIAHFQRAIALAADCHDIARLCWAQLRLLLVVSDRSGPDSVLPLLSELRRHVMRAGDPGIMAALHIYLAETEAKRGLVRNARRHASIASKGLTGFSNRWLEARLANVESAIAMIESDLGTALNHARRCLDLAEESGAASLRESASGNLGNLAFLASHFEEAIKCLLCVNAVRKGSENWTACADTLARVYLAQDRVSDCETLLNEIDAAVVMESDRSRYVYRHTQLTRVHLYTRKGLTDEALNHIDLILTLANRSADRLLRDLALLTKADILQADNRIGESALLLQSLVEDIPNRSPDFYAQYERTLACALVRGSQYEVAESHYRCAARIYTGLRHAAGQLELTRCWANALEQAPAAAIDSTSSRPNVLAKAILAGVATVATNSWRPELVAPEIIELLALTECVQHAAAVWRTSNGSTESLVEIGDRRRATLSDTKCLVIGARGERQIEIVLTPNTDLESIATINSITLLIAAVRDLAAARAEREERATLWPVDELPVGGDGAVTVGHMQQTMALAKKIANSNVSVLITGESGTGKEVVARAIHAHSGRAQKPFIPFNCTAVPRELLESQLFGYRRGAFTGAERDNPGVVRTAKDGTLFLDEIGDLSLDLQPKLLRFLESGEICPLGESTPIVANVRVIAATNSNLASLVREGRFREDLFYRLNVIRLTLLPLRERRDEIPTLVSHFLMRAAEEFRKSHIRLAEETVERLVLYSWPGNVRQLQNEVRRMVALAEPGTVLHPDALSSEIFTSTADASAGPPVAEGQTSVHAGEKLNPALSRIEREMIKAALRDHHGKLEPAARALGISRKGLYLKRQRLGL